MDLESKQLLNEIKQAFVAHNDNVKKSVNKAVKEAVNGKIELLTSNFNAWKESEARERQKVKDALDVYIEKTKPMVEFFEDVGSTKKVLLWALGIIGSIGGVWIMVKEIFR